MNQSGETDIPPISGISLDALHSAFRHRGGSGQHISRLFDVDKHQEAVDAGFVRLRPHPTEPLIIHNYTQACTWNNAWDDITTQCRGLITHAETGEVVARPFRKFFNYGQPGSPDIGLDEDVVVFDKADGSLGIAYPTRDGFSIATRGSFTSDQAVWATQFFREQHSETFRPDPQLTYMFEIIHPDNRIVVDYGDRRDLVLLGAVETATGRSVALDVAREGWRGTVVDQVPYRTLGEVLSAPERPNAEGFVIWHPATDARVKVKHAEYMRLHKLIYGVNERHVWDIVARGGDISGEFSGAPDEFHAWVKGVERRLRTEHATKKREVDDAFQGIIEQLGREHTRRDFAELAKRHPLKSFLFLRLDGRDIDASLWDSLRPSGDSGGMY